jgi:hypothetical protein
MRDDWIIDVLADLSAFARQNNLPRLAAQIEVASLVAVAELVVAGTDCPGALPEDVRHAGRVLRSPGQGRDAR